MTSVVQWISKLGLSHRDKALSYLEENPAQLPAELIRHINYWWPEAFESQRVCEILATRTVKYCDRESKAFGMYNDLVEELVNSESIRSILAHVSVLFFEYPDLFNPSNQSFKSLFIGLNKKQRVKYAHIALDVDGYLIRQIPKALRTQEMYEMAVNCTADALKWVPPANRTPEMIDYAVRNSAYVLEYLTEEQQLQYLSISILNPGSDDSHWPADFWNRPWVMKLLSRVPKEMLSRWKREWKQKKDDAENRWHGEQAAGGWWTSF